MAVDLCTSSTPNQVIAARLDRKTTLAATLAEMDERTIGAHRFPFTPLDTLLVPRMHWRMQHRFRELENRPFLNASMQKLYLDPALQLIDFRMDETGVSLKSQSLVGAKGGPIHYHCDQPFMIVMKKRGAQHPFFVMWVDNAELLERR